MSGFAKEADFEAALIAALQNHGWERKVLYHPTEQDLIQNWAQILYENNQTIDRLNGQPLVEEEMDQLLDQIRIARTPHPAGLERLYQRENGIHQTVQSGGYAPLWKRSQPEDI